MRKWIWKLVKGALWSEAEGRISTRKLGGLLVAAAPLVTRWFSKELGIELPEGTAEALLLRLVDYLAPILGALVIRARNDEDALRQEIRKARVAAIEAASRPTATVQFGERATNKASRP